MYLIIILSMLLYIIGWALVFLEYLSQLGKLHQASDYIVYWRYCIIFNSIILVLKV